MIATYRGIIRDGKAELHNARLPEGAEVIVVAEAFLTLEEQAERLAVLTLEEWQSPFLLHQSLFQNHPGEAQEEDLTDQAWNTLVHDR
jgi:hypothetical protein